MNDSISRLQQWYSRQCDGHWEHSFGIRIETLDNPGWHIRIDIAGTDLEGLDFQPLGKGLEKPADGMANTASTDWYSMSVNDRTFDAAGDPSKLEFMLQTFLVWERGTANNH
jgi:Immunity protein 53